MKGSRWQWMGLDAAKPRLDAAHPGWMLRTQALGSGRGQSSIKMKYVLRRAVVLTRRH